MYRIFFAHQEHVTGSKFGRLFPSVVKNPSATGFILFVLYILHSCTHMYEYVCILCIAPGTVRQSHLICGRVAVWMGENKVGEKEIGKKISNVLERMRILCCKE